VYFVPPYRDKKLSAVSLCVFRAPLHGVQSGFGRSGKFCTPISYIKPDIICMAKGMGNGFPIGGILIAPHFKGSKFGLLGTTLAAVIWLVPQVSPY
jgi:hypothetical protein